jgi:predicted AAA+ superfamily ATPase
MGLTNLPWVVHPGFVPHHRSRYLENHIREGLKFSPIVGVLGQRQVGKTTLVESIAGSNYLSLDDSAQLELAMSNAAGCPEFVS